MKNLSPILVAVAGWTLLCAAPAQAYLDPGTGNFIFQLLLGTIVGAAATFKIWWSRVLAFVRPKPKS